jgi:hypothetical protein
MLNLIGFPLYVAFGPMAAVPTVLTVFGLADQPEATVLFRS